MQSSNKHDDRSHRHNHCHRGDYYTLIKVAVVVVAVATVAARVEVMREVVEVAGEGGASRQELFHL